MTNPSVDYLFIDMNSYFASCEQQRQPHLRDKPVIVVALNVDTTSAIAASHEAKKLGIKAGTTVRDAKKIFPKIQIVEANHEIYVDFHHQIIEAVENILPVNKVLSIDEMNCKLTGSQKNLNNALLLAEKIQKNILNKCGERMTSSIGLANNPFLAKVAGDLKKPHGISVLLKENVETILSSFPIRTLPGIGAQMEKRLQSVGIFYIKDLYAASFSRMNELWGSKIGGRYYHWLRGEDIEVSETVQKSMGHEHVLEPELRNYEGGLSVLKKLCAKLAVRLRKENLFTKKISVSINCLNSNTDLPLRMESLSTQKNKSENAYERFKHFETFDTFQNLSEINDTPTLLKNLNRLYETFPKSVKPIRVSVSFSNLISTENHQFSLFSKPKDDTLSRSIDKINEKYGKNTITFASIHDFKSTAPTRIAFSRVPKKEEF